ncbi:cytochrome C [Flavobacterium alvei]|jgi:hypothetical protein|uniref:Cytochrome C n=1 Tax=Flavobacterium alvei TaxID=2080416 RepID=A0A2S5A554_9FLAO|nr:heme-binding domain-containing protein [Flavobacterium alvei]POY37718.1 cytochrome C [Flavobacterium alvei]
MKISIKKILFIGLIIFLLMQLYQPARNIGFEQDITADFTKVYNVPKKVEIILRTSCYDCHSNNTNYPWYSYIQPARFLMESHIAAGKENLNFNEWGNYSSRKQNNKLDRIAKQIQSNEMPLASYTLIHKNATLSATQKKEVLDWINKIEDSL